MLIYEDINYKAKVKSILLFNIVDKHKFHSVSFTQLPLPRFKKSGDHTLKLTLTSYTCNRKSGITTFNPFPYRAFDLPSASGTEHSYVTVNWPYRQRHGLHLQH